MCPRRTNPGGVRQYVDWARVLSAEDCFSDRGCRDMFKRNALNMISRTNTINGRRYRDDPTIFGWVRTPRRMSALSNPWA
jgi:mannan endo-1,4-beta-mannosidase